MPAEFHWLRPEWFWALPVVGLLLGMLMRQRLAAGAWQKVIDPQLMPYILTDKVIRGTDWRWWLAGVGAVLAITALAGPSWERIEQPVYRSDQALVIALDLSRSMDSQDLSPSRLARARLKILDILRRRQGGQTALVVYSANAFTVTPLTTDTDTIAALVNSLSTDIMPSQGSYPVAAINKGRTLLEQAGVRNGEVLLITDGQTSNAAEQAAKNLYDTGYSLSVLGVGTRQGAPIPQPGGGFVTDRSGTIFVPKIEPAQLRDLAAAGHGRFTMLTTDESDLDRLLSGTVDVKGNSDESLATDQWREEGPWLVLLLLPLAASAFRRGWILLLIVVVAPLTVPTTAYAFSWQDLWQTGDQQGQALLEQGDAAAAAERFSDPAWQAVAHYRAGDYDASGRLFAGVQGIDSLYNLGNALARKGDFEIAIQAYNEVLDQDPENEDALFNRDLLQQQMDQQKQQSGENQDQSEKQDGESQQNSESKDGEASDQQSDGDSQNSGDGEPQDSESKASDEQEQQADLDAMQEELDRAAEEARQQTEEQAADKSEAELAAERQEMEQKQAMEQWLRRIPNDPGGLLRRKFRMQYERQGRDQDGNNLWPDDEEHPW